MSDSQSYPGDLSKRQRDLVDNPERSLVTSLNTLFNAMRIVQGTRQGKIDPALFSTSFKLVNEEDQSQGLQVNPAQTPIPADLIAENMMMNVAAACFLQHDEVARQVFSGGTRFRHSDAEIRNTCSILFLVRCAFAHNPLIPTWLIDSRFRDKLYDVPEIGLQLNTTGLHRQVGVLPRIGGWVGAVKLLGYAHKLISPQTAAWMQQPDE